jgi:hypothetical protein
MSSEVETSRCETIASAAELTPDLADFVRCVAASTSLRFARNDGDWLKQRGPASFPAGPFVKLPELSGHCYAASAGAAGAATAAACVTGRDRCRARQRQHCCNQE